MGLAKDSRERTVRRALGVPATSARLHQTCRPVGQNKHVCVEKCPLTTRNMAKAAVAAIEQECRTLLKELWRDPDPEAKSRTTEARPYPYSG